MSEPVEVKAASEHMEEDTKGDLRNVLLFDEAGNIRNIPLPSKSPDDPLNFSPWRQRIIMAVLCIYGCAGFGVVQSAPLYFGDLIAQYMKETQGQFHVARINDLSSYPSLCMGLGNFLFVPLSMGLGRRMSFLICNVLMVGSTVWAGKSTAFSSHLAARCLQGLSSGIGDCLLPIIILDISFLHKRSARLVFYWTMTTMGSSLLLVAVPWTVQAANHNWRVNYYFWAGWAGLSLILATLFLPETIFERPAMALHGQVLATNSYGTVRSFASIEAAREAGFTIADNSDNENASVPPRRVQLMPIHCQNPGWLKRILRSFQDIFLCLLIPGCFWTLLLNTLLFAGLVILSLYYSRSLEAPPWNFSAAAVGTVQLGSAIGAVLSLLFTGMVAERIVEFQTRRNRGVRKPEFHLVNFILPTIFAFVGLSVYAVVTNKPTSHSWVGVHAAFAIYYFAFCAISAFTGVWLAEFLPEWSGPAIVLCSGGRNAVSFGISHVFDKWIVAMGYKAYIMLGGLILVMMALSPFVLLLNRFSRRWTAYLIGRI